MREFPFLVADNMNFQQALLMWYQVHQRKLPFRESGDPYHIWISEIMLQQTQMDTVLPYYERFMKAFPTVFDLAKATQEQVMRLWAGLGYYSRARNLHKCAKVLVDEFQGRFPEDYAQALKLPGIGPYTAGAVLSIGYNKKIPAVDGNVLRVYSRLFNSHADIGEVKNKKAIENKIRQLIPENARDFNQAMMELGALICLPKNPKCEICPINNSCQAKQLSIQNELPIKSKKPINKKIPIAVGIIRRSDQILITKTDTPLLKGLWAFPTAQGIDQDDAKSNLLSALKDIPINIRKIGDSNNVFTHITWQMSVYEIQYPEALQESSTQPYDSGNRMSTTKEKHWVAKDELPDYPMATAFKKLIQLI